MEDTIFTKIIKGEIPSYKVYEDERTFAFLDIHPLTPGHTMVIPKAQVEFIWDLEPEDYHALMATVQKVGKHLREVMDVPYVGVEVTGIDVPHTHVHVVPFTSSSEMHRSGATPDEPDHAALAAVIKKVAFV
jgi:histidine triad (HIT) family protein